MEKLILNNKKRIIAFMLAFTIVLSSFYVDYQKAYALDWAITEISLTSALKVLMGLLGVTVCIEVTDDWWEQQYNDCFNYTMNDVEVTEQQITEWWNNVKKGILDKTSPVWESFKEWVKSLTSSSVNSDFIVVEGGTYTIDNVEYNINKFNAYFNTYTFNNITVTGYFSSSSDYVNDEISNFFISSNSSFDLTVSYPIRSSNFTYDNKTVYYIYPYRNYSYSVTPIIENFVSNPNTIFSDYSTSLGLMAWLSVYSSTSSDVSDYISAYENIENIDAISDESTDVTSETAIPLPWQNDESIADSLEDVIDNAIDKVQTGEMTIEEYWEYVQEITNVYVYDITTDETLPITVDSETGETEKIDDKITENKDNMAFTLSDLEKVFPFCIPFDIYAFVTLLVAEPVAPFINFPITSVNGQTEVITIDFSEWESIVILFRYIFDFLLIIGLLLLARSLVGAGGDD